MSDSRRPDDGSAWPERDLQKRGDDLERPAAPPESGPEPHTPQDAEHPDPRSGVAVPAVEAGEPSTAFNGSAWDPRVHGERRRPTTAEQAVPWMIGLILALAGIVIVLLALIFTAPEGLIAGGTASPRPSRTPPASPAAAATGSFLLPSPSATPAASPTPEAPEPSPTPSPTPEYGPLEMVYLGRPSPVAPVYLLRRDFSTDAEPTVVAQADQDIAKFAWSPDGRVGAALIGERAVALTPGESARALADGVSALTFGWDSETLYAVRIRPDGGNDVSEILQIDFVSGDASVLGRVSYPRPATGPEPPLREAQFIDDGGLVRLYAAADGNLVLWVLGAPATYRVDAGDGRVSEIEDVPTLWSPDGRVRVTPAESGGSTTLNLEDRSGDVVASTAADGLVSHIRWVHSSNEIVFTLGRLGSGGGVRQDLYVWDLQDGKAPMALTSNGVSFGAEWLRSAPNWLP